MTNNNNNSICGWCGKELDMHDEGTFCSTTCEEECMSAYEEDMSQLDWAELCSIGVMEIPTVTCAVCGKEVPGDDTHQGLCFTCDFNRQERSI